MSASPFSSGYSVPNTVSAGLQVPIGPGSNNITGLTVTYPGSTLTMSINATNYGYIDPATGLIAVNTTGFTSGQIPIFTATTDPFKVTAINDVRLTYAFSSTGAGGPFVQLNPTANQAITGAFSLSLSNPAASLLIGTSTPVASYALEIHETTFATEALFTHNDTGFQGPQLYLAKSRGTQALPTLVVLGDTLGYLTFKGYDGVTYATGTQILTQTVETWNSTTHGATIVFQATALGGNSAAEVFRMGQAAASGFAGNVSRVDLAIENGHVLGWYPSAFTFLDTGISRISAAVVAMGNGTQGDVTGQLRLGNITFTSAAPTVAAAQVGLGSTTAASATAGGGQAALATVLGYLVANVAGTTVKIPYFSN